MRRKCECCGKVKTVKYEHAGYYYCSIPCAAVGARIRSVYECSYCGMRFNEAEPERIWKRTPTVVVHLTSDAPVYCSLLCALNARGCIKVNGNGEPEQANATDN